MTSIIPETVFNQKKAENFANDLVATLNHGALCLMVSIGHRTGLFDTLSTTPPGTSKEIVLSFLALSLHS